MSSQSYGPSWNSRESAFDAAGTDQPLVTSADVDATSPEHTGTRQFSVVGRTLTFKGDLVAEEDLLIQGNIHGSVTHTGHNLTIGAHARIEGNVTGRKIIVQGQLTGHVHASESVVIEASAHVTGNLFAPRVGIKEGAKFKGGVDMEGTASRQTATDESAARKTGNNRARKNRDDKGRDDSSSLKTDVDLLLS